MIEPILEEIARQTGVDVNRLSVSPTFFNRNDKLFRPFKTIMLDDKPLKFRWSPELKQDIDDLNWSHTVREHEKKLSRQIIEGVVKELKDE
tara:strand:+ start:966 stop:1238 length:273 start_codon:yes stop_codon:yes gene_type:complete